MEREQKSKDYPLLGYGSPASARGVCPSVDETACLERSKKVCYLLIHQSEEQTWLATQNSEQVSVKANWCTQQLPHLQSIYCKIGRGREEIRDNTSFNYSESG